MTASVMYAVYSTLRTQRLLTCTRLAVPTELCTLCARVCVCVHDTYLAAAPVQTKQSTPHSTYSYQAHNPTAPAATAHWPARRPPCRPPLRPPHVVRLDGARAGRVALGAARLGRWRGTGARSGWVLRLGHRHWTSLQTHTHTHTCHLTLLTYYGSIRRLYSQVSVRLHKAGSE